MAQLYTRHLAKNKGAHTQQDTVCMLDLMFLLMMSKSRLFIFRGNKQRLKRARVLDPFARSTTERTQKFQLGFFLTKAWICSVWLRYKPCSLPVYFCVVSVPYSDYCQLSVGLFYIENYFYVFFLNKADQSR